MFANFSRELAFVSIITFDFLRSVAGVTYITIHTLFQSSHSAEVV